MIKVMQFTCLKLHHTGEQIFAPVEVGGSYQLQSALSVLCGKRGNIFNFTSWVTARAWIDDNLAKVAKSGKTKDDFLLDLIIEQSERPQPYLALEIETIEARNAGDWSVYFADELLERFELGYYVALGQNETGNLSMIDGGQSNTIF